MIFSHFSAGDDFSTYPKAIRTALQFLKDNDIAAMQPGHYPIDGERIYARVMDLTTKPLAETMPEAHQRYCDVQYWPEGREVLGVALDLGGNPVHSHDVEADMIYYSSVPNESFITAFPGCFAVFFPYDIHRVAVCDGAPQTFRKCIVKVSMEALKD